jgi:transposase
VPGRSAAPSCEWFAKRPQVWRDRIRWATLDLSGPYRNVFDTMLPDAVQVADPFHVVKLVATCVDEVHRRVQNDT